MKKNYLQAFLIVFVFAFNTFAQQKPAVCDSLLVEDLVGASKMLKFGLDPTASDTIDIAFGESDLPPFPPAGGFDARFLLPQNNYQGTLSSYEDYRKATLPYTGQIEFRLQYQGGGTMMKFSWNFPDSVTGVFQDLLGGAIVNVNMIGSGSYTLTIPDILNKMKMLIDYHSIVPVELVSFGVSISESSINLSWETATELNNKGFEVQRKSENGTWEKIGFVEGYGTTTEMHNYIFKDVYSGQGITYYRLKQVDLDGKISYSKILSLNLGAPSNFVLNQNFPNPFNPSTNISFFIPNQANVKITIYNQIGEKVTELLNKNLAAGSYNYSWDASGQASGVYFYEIQTGDFRAIKKMTLIK